MSIYKIEFSAICQTVPGELVYICGNVTELGNWQPLKSLRLYTEDSLYPKWNSYQTIQIRYFNLNAEKTQNCCLSFV